MKLLFFALIVLLTVPTSEKVESFEPIVVLELFTSQGCSSCPPADRLLVETSTNADHSNVLTLSYHVDYWNYIGWKDPFSKAEFSKKQRRYGQKFNNSTVYTPQLVINGKEHFVGSNQAVLNSKLKVYSKKNAENSIAISNVKRNGNHITFDYDIEGKITGKRLRTALTIDERITTVSRGENRNRDLKNSNIVVAETENDVSTKTGKGKIEIPNLVTSTDQLSLIFIIQTIDLNIVGATSLKL